MNEGISVAGIGLGWFVALIAAPVVLYVGAYLLFRCWGKLRVNTKGWHASGVCAGRRVVFSALRLFGWYQPLLRLESAVARKTARLFRTEKREQPVSDVVVELVQFT